MKKLINILTLILTVSLIALCLPSCDWLDETLKPPLDPPEDRYDPAKVGDISGDSSKTVRYYEEDLIDFESILDEELDAESGLTFGEALESIDPDVHPDWKVRIKSYRCPGNAQTLLVYNPGDQDLSFYGSRFFSVHWFKDGQPVRGNSIKLDCVCKGRYAVIVVLKRTNQGIGIAFHTGRVCFADDTVKLQDANN